MNFEEIVEFAARATHEVNRVYCQALGDESQPHWEEAPEWQKESAREGVKASFIDRAPERSHERWVEKKIREGWSYGPVKDPEKKIHPCLVPFAKLPVEQQMKDFLFVFVGPVVAQVLSGSIPEITVRLQSLIPNAVTRNEGKE